MKYVRGTIIIIMFTFLVLPFLLDFKAEAAAGEDYIKVGLKYGSSAVSDLTLKSETGFLLGTAGNGRFEEGMPLPAYNALVITNENGAIVIRDEGGVLLSADLGSTGCIMPANYEDGGVLFCNGTPYRGGIMLLAKSGRSITVINYVTLEHYLYGVLNSELSHTNPMEALKAQAVTARSYGAMNLGTHAADGFDLCSGTHCQVYQGYSGEYPATVRAVDETRGEQLYCHGTPVMAFYFKNSGGHTQNSEDVWTYDHPYLKGVKDEYSPSYPWNASLSFDTIRTKLEAGGFRPGAIQSVSVSGRNGNGAVSELKITGDTATVYLRKENIRTILGATTIKSNRFELADSTASKGGQGWTLSNGSKTGNSAADLYVINGSGKAVRLDGASAYATNGRSTAKLGSAGTVETVTGGTVVFSGYGYGHGVGMPQDSAVEMAKKGFSYDEILDYYYTDIEIR